LVSSILRLAVLASGQGTNLQNIHEQISSGELPSVELALVVSNNSRSGAMEYAREQGIESAHVSAQRHGSQEAADQALFELLEITKIDLIVLAGYMKKLPQLVVEKFDGRIINVHPALLPSFGGEGMYGERVHAAVLARGCKVSGATAHLVTHDYDEGPILLQECCAVTDDESVESLARKVREIEFRLLPAAIHLVAEKCRVIRND
jgi:phosphoribosylglycinamide formyltransferase 1